MSRSTSQGNPRQVLDNIVSKFADFIDFVRCISKFQLTVEDAEDVCQESFMQFAAKLTGGNYNYNEPPEKLVYTISRYRTYDALRKKGREIPICSIADEFIGQNDQELPLMELRDWFKTMSREMPTSEKMVAKVYLVDPSLFVPVPNHEEIVKWVDDLFDEKISIENSRMIWSRIKKRLQRGEGFP